MNQAEFRLEYSDNMSDKLESKVGRDIIREMEKKNQIKDTTLTVKLDEKDIHIKASSIHQLVKRFAKGIFKQYKIS